MKLLATGKDPAIRVRFPEHVIAALKRSSEKNARSFNSEIVYRVAEGLGLIDVGSKPPPAPDRALATTP